MTQLECIKVEKQIYERAFSRLLKRMKDSICSPDKNDFKYVLDNEIDFVNLQCCYASLLHHREMVRLYPNYAPYRETLQYLQAAFKAQTGRIDAERRGEIVWIQRNLYNKSRQVKWRIYMGRVYKNYTKELKEQACKLVVKKNIPVRIVAEKLSV